MNGFEFHCPTKIVAGVHALDKIPDELASQHVAHPLVMTDPGLAKLGVSAKLTRVLDAAGVPYDVYDQVPADSSMDVVNEVAHLYSARGCDGFVAIGGGSVIDTTKGAAASLSCEGADFATLQGSEILHADLPPIIAVPTTAGTGSEVTLVAVVADTEQHAKLSFTSCSTPTSRARCRRNSRRPPAWTRSPTRSRRARRRRKIPCPMRSPAARSA